MSGESTDSCYISEEQSRKQSESQREAEGGEETPGLLAPLQLIEIHTFSECKCTHTDAHCKYALKNSVGVCERQQSHTVNKHLCCIIHCSEELWQSLM